MTKSNLNMQVLFGSDGIAQVVYINHGASVTSSGDYFIVTDDYPYRSVDGYGTYTYTYHTLVDGVETLIYRDDALIVDDRGKELERYSLYDATNRLSSDRNHVLAVDFIFDYKPYHSQMYAYYHDLATDFDLTAVWLAEGGILSLNDDLYFDGATADPSEGQSSSGEANGESDFTYDDSSRFIVMDAQRDGTFQTRIGTVDDIRLYDKNQTYFANSASFLHVIEADTTVQRIPYIQVAVILNPLVSTLIPPNTPVDELVPTLAALLAQEGGDEEALVSILSQLADLDDPGDVEALSLITLDSTMADLASLFPYSDLADDVKVAQSVASNYLKLGNNLYYTREEFSQLSLVEISQLGLKNDEISPIVQVVFQPVDSDYVTLTSVTYSDATVYAQPDGRYYADDNGSTKDFVVTYTPKNTGTLTFHGANSGPVSRDVTDSTSTENITYRTGNTKLAQEIAITKDGETVPSSAYSVRLTDLASGSPLNGIYLQYPSNTTVAVALRGVLEADYRVALQNTTIVMTLLSGELVSVNANINQNCHVPNLGNRTLNEVTAVTITSVVVAEEPEVPEDPDNPVEPEETRRLITDTAGSALDGYDLDGLVQDVTLQTALIALLKEKGLQILSETKLSVVYTDGSSGNPNAANNTTNCNVPNFNSKLVSEIQSLTITTESTGTGGDDNTGGGETTVQTVEIIDNGTPNASGEISTSDTDTTTVRGALKDYLEERGLQLEGNSTIAITMSDNSNIEVTALNNGVNCNLPGANATNWNNGNVSINTVKSITITTESATSLDPQETPETQDPQEAQEALPSSEQAPAPEEEETDSEPPTETDPEPQDP